jgi:hypothetical protein
VLAVFAMVAPGAALAQAQESLVVAEAPPPEGAGPNLLMLNPGDLFGGVASIEYERALTSRFGLTVGLQVRSFRPVYATPGDLLVTSVNPELGARFHFFRDAPGGAWLAATVTGGAVLARSDGVAGRGWSWGVGAAAGYNFVLERHLTFQFGLGGGFLDYGDRVVWSPRLLLGVGVAF